MSRRRAEPSVSILCFGNAAVDAVQGAVDSAGARWQARHATIKFSV